jgi:hypothetical protein
VIKPAGCRASFVDIYFEAGAARLDAIGYLEKNQYLQAGGRDGRPVVDRLPPGFLREEPRRSARTSRPQ